MGCIFQLFMSGKLQNLWNHCLDCLKVLQMHSAGCLTFGCFKLRKPRLPEIHTGSTKVHPGRNHPITTGGAHWTCMFDVPQELSSYLRDVWCKQHLLLHTLQKQQRLLHCLGERRLINGTLSQLKDIRCWIHRNSSWVNESSSYQMWGIDGIGELTPTNDENNWKKGLELHWFHRLMLGSLSKLKGFLHYGNVYYLVV